ncbi:MAG: hypothetical protein H6739_08195 [Alphaproteobacteria bacterium]|nr:hypothetical protein [Alphaproteobacteria bacterium]
MTTHLLSALRRGGLVALLAAGCAPPEVVERAPGVRAPLSAECSEVDPARCLLPWPSNTFTRADPSTETGLRLDVQTSALPVADDPGFLNLANGFSRVTGVATAIEGAVDTRQVSLEDVTPSLSPDGPLQVFNAQPGSARYGQRVAFVTELMDASTLSTDRYLFVGRPQEVMEANADHVVVVLKDLAPDEAPSREVLLSLALVEPETDAEAAVVGYHAPTRALLAEAGVDPERVLRVWDFTTRSRDDIAYRTHAMMDTLEGALDDLAVEIDVVSFPSNPALAWIVLGRLTGAPSFLDEDGKLVLDDAGRPLVTGTTDIVFRMSMPAGEGTYHVALYGHGTGGDVNDNLFDNEMAESDVAKLNLRFDGWTGEDFLLTITGFSAFLEGTETSTAGLMQAMAGGTVLLSALDGVLGDALTAETLNGEPNEAAGRVPDTDEVVWLGGSLGGTLGAVVVSADERLTTAVLNVPGAGWTHMIPHSLLYDSGVGAIMLEVYDDVLDLQLAILMSQGSWDDVDGAVWADEALEVGGNFLLQQSMGDPVLPNVGTNLLSSALGAVQFEPSLDPRHDLASTTGQVTSGAALEQFRVPDTGVFDVHGFAARDTIAGEAALAQIIELLESYWAGDTHVSHPALCAEYGLNGTCDFTEAIE